MHKNQTPPAICKTGDNLRALPLNEAEFRKSCIHSGVRPTFSEIVASPAHLPCEHELATDFAARVHPTHGLGSDGRRVRTTASLRACAPNGNPRERRPATNARCAGVIGGSAWATPTSRLMTTGSRTRHMVNDVAWRASGPA